jgi:hypothetical protein
VRRRPFALSAEEAAFEIEVGAAQPANERDNLQRREEILPFDAFAREGIVRGQGKFSEKR